MTQARKKLVDPATTPYYHCINRCVRRAFLCGEDEMTAKNYDHRKTWVVERLKTLAEVFAIEICAYAVMSNHYHLVLHINSAKAKAWNNKEVAERWCTLYKGHPLVHRWLEGEGLSSAERDAVSGILDLWRKRLTDISWFMRCLNESLARKANEEDECKGHFWEGRFKSQALLDEAAILSCMMYVDLNPVRAGISDTLDGSDFTSIQQRLSEFAERKAGRPRRQATKANKQADKEVRPALMGFEKEHHNEHLTAPMSTEALMDDLICLPKLPFAFDDYCQLIDWTGRAVREDKAGHIPPEVAPLLQQLGVRPDKWLTLVQHSGHGFHGMMGCLAKMQQMTQKLRQHWCRGFALARQCYEVNPPEHRPLPDYSAR